MARSLPARRFCSGILALVSWCIVSNAGAEEQALLEKNLEAGPVSLEVFSAEVRVFLDASSEGFLRVTAPAGSPTDQMLLDWTESTTGSKLLRQPVPELVSEAKAPDLAIDLILSPRAGLKVSGTELRVSIERVRTDTSSTTSASTVSSASALPATETASPGPAGQESATELPGAIRIDVADSSVDLWGIGDLVLDARQSEIRIEQGKGIVHLTLFDSIAEIRDHRGDLMLAGEGSNLDLVDHEGILQLDWRSGELNLQKGRGTISGKVRDALAQIVDMSGPVTLEGTGSTISCRESKAPKGAISLQGEDLQVVLEGWNGRVEARLAGGLLRGSTWRGKGDLTLSKGAGLDVHDLRGEFKVGLQSGSEARIEQVLGQLKATVHQGSLTVEGAQRLDLIATESRATVSDIKRLLKLSAREAELDLDFSTIEDRRPKLDLKGHSRVEIRLASPCIVELMSGRAVDDSGVEISGCELMRGGQGRRKNPPLRVNGRPMTHLLLTADPDAEIRVEGR